LPFFIAIDPSGLDVALWSRVERMSADTRQRQENIMRFPAFMAACCVAAVGVTAAAQTITHDFDRATNFAAFKTYAWVRGTVLADEINHNRVVDAVNAELATKGLTRADAGEAADLFVAYHASFDRNLQISGFATGWGPYRFGGRSAVAHTEQILTGTLVIDIIEARTKTIVWRGIASKEVDTKADPAKRDRNIRRAAERLFRNYPPAK
jgi:hypothetical protein